MEENKIELNRKHVGLRIILFIVALGVAATFISIGIASLVSKKDGEYKITSEYDNNYICAFYLEGSNSQIHKKQEEINQSYSSLLKKNYSLLSNESSDDSFYGISYLNKHINEDIKIDKYAYDILLEAYNYSKTYNNYSIFSKPIYDIWDSLFQLKKFDLNYEEKDPVNSEYNGDLLSRLSSSIKDEDMINIEFKGDNVIRVNVNEEYLSLLKENELDKSIVSLNILYDAYIADKLYSEFKEKEYSKCYFKTLDSLFVISYDDISLNITDSSLTTIGRLSFKDSDYKVSSYKLFSLINNDISEYYLLEKDGIKYNRTHFINIDEGYPVNEIKQNIIVSKDNKSSVELSLINNELLISDNNYDIIMISSKDDGDITISKELESLFTKVGNNYQYNFI